MGILRSTGRLRGKRWILFATVKASISLVILVSAVSIPVTTHNLQGEFGSAFNVANNLLATDKGFSLDVSGSPASGTNCSSPVVFGSSPKMANTTIAAGHLAYDVQVNSTSGAPASKTYNVTIVLSQTSYGPLCIETPASPADGQTIDCRFDVGTKLPASPFSFKVTVQPT